ncbi:hypothetical protein HMPREF0281_02259 [Corynebacterium ammoniagenes DSM 20306]|uniref:Uncharacterized protein n=1 Tax=Corynebacterium ammoniagenes DSM 20306 TaxID=649754 RepID=A0ABP2I9S6_CORAM|nr:hypothetical protein HMPREF0281_02259 [Corynebacterium ammoniagenes DSM 20306]
MLATHGFDLSRNYPSKLWETLVLTQPPAPPRHGNNREPLWLPGSLNS